MENDTKTRAERFVEYVLRRSEQDTGFAARLRRADNRDTEDQSWGALAAFGVDLERDQERLPFALIGAAICRAGLEKDGEHGLGSALEACFEDSGADASERQKAGSARLRRLLACASVREACQTLRPLLQMINGKSRRSLCHAALLRDLLYFETAGAERIKKHWAMDFYAPARKEPEEAES